jgi:hypothetical protein
MASKRHQFIIGLINRKILELGFTILSLDGKILGAFDTKYDLPPKILRHRPDTLGINHEGHICIGEAKTESDLFNLRTKEEFIDFSSIELNGKLCLLIIGIPVSASKDLDRLLINIGIFENTNVQILKIPNEIIND